ncbi:hypothetical protein OG349_16275 [Streptomyces sp. NBC_01317]|nr:hypothetical protein OG349_16275 [Streptomyces sp. NBC_01317]
MKWLAKRVPAPLLATVLLAGCGNTGNDKGAAATMNMQEAAERSDSLLDATFGAIRPEVQWAHDDTSAGNCDVVRRRVVLTVISEQRRGSFLGVIERFWKKSGFDIISVNRSVASPDIYAKTADGFTIGLIIGDRGQAFFEADTPCVEKSTVTEPATKPNGPAYAGVQIPYPNVHSAFWSASDAG